jgi:hypothetical protein
MGEVHRFSAWRALVAVLIPPIILVIVVGLVVFLIALITGHH